MADFQQRQSETDTSIADLVFPFRFGVHCREQAPEARVAHLNKTGCFAPVLRSESGISAVFSGQAPHTWQLSAINSSFETTSSMVPKPMNL